MGGALAAESGAGTPTPARGPSPRTVLAIASLGASVAFVDATIVNIAFPDIGRSFRAHRSRRSPGCSTSTTSSLQPFRGCGSHSGPARAPADLHLRLGAVHRGVAAVRRVPIGRCARCVPRRAGARRSIPRALFPCDRAQLPPEQRSHGVALLSAVAAAAAGLGPSLGGLLVTADNWRLVFLVNLPIGLAAVLLARRHLVESRAPGRHRCPTCSARCCSPWRSQPACWGSSRVRNGAGAAPGDRLVRSRQRSRRRVHVAMLMASLTDHRPLSATHPHVQRSQRDDDRRGGRLLWLHADKRPVPDRRLEILGARRGLALTPGPFVAAAVAGPTSRLVHASDIAPCSSWAA